MAASLPALALVVLVVDERVVFEMRRHNGDPVPVLLFQLLPDGEPDPIWVLAPIGATREYSTGATFGGAAGKSETAQFDASLAAAAREYGVTVDRIDYGIVPEGFQQFVPEEGPPPALAAGQRYDVHVIGDGFASVSFKV
jgi:hypothetical protein